MPDMRDEFDERLKRSKLAQTMRAEMGLKLARAESVAKGDWAATPILEQFSRLDEEFHEFLEAATVGNLHPEKVWEEAADVANFAAMIADTYERAYKDARREQG